MDIEKCGFDPAANWAQNINICPASTPHHYLLRQRLACYHGDGRALNAMGWEDVKVMKDGYSGWPKQVI